MEERVLNVTNGEYFNEYFLREFGGEALPFCEAMMDGKAAREVFSEEFVAVRAGELGVSEKEYEEKMEVFRVLLREKNGYSRLCLWFGKDTFCQMNLLTLLAFLDQIRYGGKVVLNLVDDESFERIGEGVVVDPKGYGEIYRLVFIERTMPESLGVLDPRGVALYFDYHSPQGALAERIRKCGKKTERELLYLLMEESKEYGLSDLQAKKLIKAYRIS